MTHAISSGCVARLMSLSIRKSSSVEFCRDGKFVCVFFLVYNVV